MTAKPGDFNGKISVYNNLLLVKNYEVDRLCYIYDLTKLQKDQTKYEIGRFITIGYDVSLILQNNRYFYGYLSLWRLSVVVDLSVIYFK